MPVVLLLVPLDLDLAEDTGREGWEENMTVGGRELWGTLYYEENHVEILYYGENHGDFFYFMKKKMLNYFIMNKIMLNW